MEGDLKVIFRNVVLNEDKPGDVSDDPVWEGHKKDDCPDFSAVVDVGKAAKLQRAFKWAGLKPVSWQ